MPELLPIPDVGPGGVAYGDVDLSSPFLKSRLTGAPVLNRSGRAIKYWKYQLEVKGYIIPLVGTTTDDGVVDLRKQLTRPGQLLQYDAVGFGEFLSIGPGGIIQDVNNGPMPEMIEYETYNAKTVKFTWRVTFCIPEQTKVEGSKGPKDWLATDWSWSQDIDNAGYIKTHWDVAVEIGIPIQANRQINDVADEYRQRCQPPLPIQFSREQTWSLSDDRRTLTGSITDTQRPVALPAGTALMNCRHRDAVSVKNGAFTIASHTISGSVVVPAGTAKSEAWQRFYVLLSSRINAALNQASTARGQVNVTTTVSNAPGGGVQVNVVQTPTSRRMRLMSLEVDEDVFGTEVRFSVTFLVYGGQLSRMLLESGLFSSVGNFVDWNKSMTGTGGAFDARGGSGGLLGSYGAARDGTIVDIGHQPGGNVIGS
jgi:hypothetical protein